MAREEDVPALSDAAWAEVRETLDAVCDTGFGHPDCKVVRDARLDTAIWQVTVKRDHTDHRVFLDVSDDTLVVLAVWHADFTHGSREHWAVLGERQSGE